MNDATKELIERYAELLYKQDARYGTNVPFEKLYATIKSFYRKCAKPFVLAAKELGYEKTLQQTFPRIQVRGVIIEPEELEGLLPDFKITQPIELEE